MGRTGRAEDPSRSRGRFGRARKDRHERPRRTPRPVLTAEAWRRGDDGPLEVDFDNYRRLDRPLLPPARLHVLPPDRVAGARRARARVRGRGSGRRRRHRQLLDPQGVVRVTRPLADVDDPVIADTAPRRHVCVRCPRRDGFASSRPSAPARSAGCVEARSAHAQGCVRERSVSASRASFAPRASCAPASVSRARSPRSCPVSPPRRTPSMPRADRPAPRPRRPVPP